MVIEMDGNLKNADWPKRTWDLPIPKSKEELIDIIGGPDEVEKFKKLPVYRWNKDKIPFLDEL